MLQVKFIQGKDFAELNEALNNALSEINSETKPNIRYELNNLIAVIEYETKEAHKGRLCCECAYWDDHNDSESLNAFCTMTGKRMRFNCNACKQYKDVRV